MMIYDATDIPFRAAIFEVSIENFNPTGFKEHTEAKYVPMWLERQQHRIYLRLFVFIKHVLQWGFLEPIIIWGNIEKQTMRIHPGVNRFILNSVLKDLPHLTKRHKPLKGWVIDWTCVHRNEYKYIFDDIKPIPRDPDGNLNMTWKVDYRTTVNPIVQSVDTFEDQYEFSPFGEYYLGTIESEQLKKEWIYKQEAHRGFGCYFNGKKIYNIGRNNPKQYEINRVAGIYQLFLKHFFDINEDHFTIKYYEAI
jgi:hypothetical protein